MDEEEKRDGEKEEEDEAATHRHPISTSHDGLPEILPLEMTNTATSTATSPSRTNTTTTHNAATTTDPNGLLAAAQQQRIAAVPALHSPAHDVMPAFGQLMGHDVRPGLATPAYLSRQPTLHYNKRRRRGHEYAAPDNGVAPKVVEIDLTDDTHFPASSSSLSVPTSSLPPHPSYQPLSSSSPSQLPGSAAAAPHISETAMSLLLRSMPAQPSLLSRLNSSSSSSSAGQPFPTINPHQGQYQPLSTTTTTIASSSTPSSSAAPEIDLTQEDDMPLAYARTDEDSDPDEEEICMEIPFGQVQAKVVNTQYFTGILTERETVRLERDPANIYDKTAIRVVNVMGTEVGEIDKRIAACFAPLMDSRTVRLQAVIAQKPAANSPIQVILQMFGQPDQKNLVVDKVMECNLPLEKYVPTKRNVILPHEDFYGAGAASSLQLVGASHDGVSLSELEGDVEKLFKSLQDEAANLPERDPPAPITSRLFPHQKQALYWMSSKERIRNTFSDEYKVLFWHKRIINGETVYFNSATNSTVKQLPPNAQGGILADDVPRPALVPRSPQSVI